VAFAQYYEILCDAELYQRPDAAIWSLREAQVFLRGGEPGESVECFAGYADDAGTGQMVAIGGLVLTLNDNTDKAFIGVDVAPDVRRRGYGGAMLTYLVDHARNQGRTVFLSESNVPGTDRETHPYVQFAAKHGFSLANVEVRRQLPLPVDDEQLDGWEQQAAPHHEGYRFETFVDDIPEVLLPSYCYLLNQLALDAPTGDIDFEAESLTPESYVIRRQKIKEQGRTVFETLAIDADGQAVAQSTICIPADIPGKAFQWGTLVRRDHRGHRLGLAVKARNLRAMQRAHPDRTKIRTCNSEDNDNMVAINVLMGFEPIELLAEFQRMDEQPSTHRA